MLTCREVTELVTDSMEHRLPLRARLSFLLHESMCVHCRAYLAQVRATVRTLGRLEVEPAPLEVRAGLSAVFRRIRRERPPPRARWIGGGRLWRGLALLVPLVAALVALSDAHGWGELGPGLGCALTEAGLGAFAIATALVISRRAHTLVSTELLVVAGAGGALVGQILLRLTCPIAHASLHVLAFHVLAVMLSSGLGVLAGRSRWVRRER